MTPARHWIRSLAAGLVLVLGLSMISGTARGDSQAAGDQPLAVVLDLSGSMDEDDGNGTIKLYGAKDALNTVIRSQASRSQKVGLWTYPGGESVDGCVAGSWVTPVGRQDPVRLSATINALTSAEGGTPTGPALRAAADSLKATGKDSAVILLVSDGLSNCGTPPCEVAQELVSEGFDITVQAMGFQVDPDGRDELTCVAQATNGSYYDATDADDLRQKIEEYGLPNMDLEVEAPQTVASGDVATITAAVTNNSAQVIPDLVLTILPASGDKQVILPAVVPPTVRLGNLPGGKRLTYTWQVPIGTVNTGGIAKFRALATSNTAVGAVKKNFTITALGPDSDVRPQTWLSRAVADGSKTKIAIFGDSYSAGEGGGVYDAQTTQRGMNECHRSAKTYLASANLNVVNVACSGAVTANVVSTTQWNETAQTTNSLVKDAKDPVDVAFTTIGGNDIGFANILSQCIIGSDLIINPTVACDEGATAAFATVSMLKPTLKETYTKLYAAINTLDLLEARDGRIAPLVVLPYPNVVPARATGTCGMDESELRFAQQLVAHLNKTIEETIAELRSEAEVYGGLFTYDGIVFADGVRSALGSHGMCTSDPYIHTPTIGRVITQKQPFAWNFAEWGHPTAKGYEAITRAIQTWSFTQNLDPSKLNPSYEMFDEAVKSLPKEPVTMTMSSTSSTPVRQRDRIRVVDSGLAPGSPAVISLSSWRYAIGTARANAEGNLDAVVEIPDYVPTGAHHLVVEGIGPTAEAITHSVPVRLGKPAPWWLSPGLIAASALAVIAAACLVVGWFTRPRP